MLERHLEQRVRFERLLGRFGSLKLLPATQDETLIQAWSVLLDPKNRRRDWISVDTLRLSFAMQTLARALLH